MTKTEQLCAQYSAQSKKIQTHQAERDFIESLLDDQCAGLQKEFRRKLSKATRATGATVMRARCWHLIAHGKSPVSVTPIASATILARKGIEIGISFVATSENINAEVSKLSAALIAFQ